MCLVLLRLLSLLLAGDKPEVMGVNAYGDGEIFPFEGEPEGDFEELFNEVAEEHENENDWGAF